MKSSSQSIVSTAQLKQAVLTSSFERSTLHA